MILRERLRDPLGWQARAVEAADRREGELRLKMQQEVVNYIAANPVRWMDFVTESHQTEMGWRTRQNFYDLTGKTSAGRVDERSRKKHVGRSRAHYINNPLYHRAVDLTADFIYGKGISTPRAAGVIPEDMEGQADQVVDLVGKLWHDPQNLRVLSGTQAQLDRCKQVLIDGEVPWLLFLNRTAYRLWPDDTLNWGQVIQHPDKSGVGLLFQRSQKKGHGQEDRWYWSTDAVWAIDEGKYEDVKERILKADYTVAGINPMAWEKSDLDNTFKNGPYLFLWSWVAEPLGMRGHPPFYSALDFGEMHYGMSGKLQTYVNNVTAITGIIKGQMTAGDISDLKSNLASKLSQTKPAPGTGTWRVEGTGQEMRIMDIPTGGGELFKTAHEISRLMVAAATGIPVHWLGDPSTGNLATATAMELPQLKMFEGWQRWFTGQYDEMFRIITRHATGNEADVSELIEIDFPELVSRDAVQMLKAVVEAKRGEVISDEDAARYVARMLGEEDVDAFWERLKAELGEEPETMTQMMESEAGQIKLLRLAFRAQRKLRGEA